ncbi:MAG: WG repeat-containing protein, partial [Bacteroidales bacterium]|nr:WG repeat-containing protein [Bacteroidales bacterium]
MGFGPTDNGFYPVADDTEKWGYVNLAGKVIIPFQFDIAYGFSEGLAAAKKNDKYGYINASGKFEIEPKYSSAGYFYQGKALIGLNDLNYFINNKGEINSEGSSDMQMMNDDYLAYKKGGLYGIKDLSGNILKAPFMSDFWGFSEGLAGVKIQGKWGFMDENFKIVITPKYTEKIVYAFHNGYARFKQNGKIGLIDKTGKIILNAQYDELYEYSDGLMAFSEAGKWGYIDLDGAVIIPPQYFSAENFKNGIAKVKTGPTVCHLIDNNNDRIISDVYDLHVFSDKIIGVNAKGGWGLVELFK